MQFAARPPSTAWESVPLSDKPPSYLWVWFKPASAPHGLVVRITPEALAPSPGSQRLTMRRLVCALGIEPPEVAGWALYGVPCEGCQGTNPAWDYPVPEPGAGVDPSIGIVMAAVGAGF